MEGSINCINSTGNRVNKTGEVVPFLDLQSYNEDESIKNEWINENIIAYISIFPKKILF